jgi:hypothetical protein
LNAALPPLNAALLLLNLERGIAAFERSSAAKTVYDEDIFGM